MCSDNIDFDYQKSMVPIPFDVSLESINNCENEKVKLIIPLPIVANLYVLSIIATLSDILSQILKNNNEVGKITFLLLTEQTNHSKFLNDGIIKHLETISNHENLFGLTEHIRADEFKSLINRILISLTKVNNESEKKNILKDMILSKIEYIDIDEYISREKISQEIYTMTNSGTIDNYLEIFIQSSFLFSWDEIHRNEKEGNRFKKLLVQKLDTAWIENASIAKLNDKTIQLSHGKNKFLLSLNEDNNEVKLTNNNDLLDTFKVEENNNLLKIYGKGYSNCFFNQLSSIINQNSDVKQILFLNNDIQDIFSIPENSNIVLLGYPNPIHQDAFKKMGDAIPTFVTPTSKYINGKNFAEYIDEFHFSGLFSKLNSTLFKSKLDIHNKDIGTYTSDRRRTFDSLSRDSIRDDINKIKWVQADTIREQQNEIVELINDGFLRIQNDTMAELKYLL